MEEQCTAEILYEVWQDDMLVASTTSKTDALHYREVYSQDGPVELETVYSIRFKGIREDDNEQTQ